MRKYSHLYKFGIHHLQILSSNHIYPLEHDLQAIKADKSAFYILNAKSLRSTNMRYKIILLLLLFIVSSFLIFEFAPASTAQSDRSPQAISKKSIPKKDAQATRYPFAPLQWGTVVNNAHVRPVSGLNFSSYGQPSVNTQGAVVFRARTTGSSDRESGIFMRQNLNSRIRDVATLDFFVPFPNNLETKFTEFPSIPRISMNATNIATRGNHQPVYKYLLPDGTETRAGTAGIYAQIYSGNRGDPLITGASKLGIVPGFEHFITPENKVPFSVFPGSPAINDLGTIVFKGNYSVDNTEKTGVFFRSLLNTPGGGNESVQLIANSDTEIPNLPPGFASVTFGSTAPPSLAGNEVVFVGLDNEDNPSFGGIYVAPLESRPALTTLIGVGATLPGPMELPRLTRIGEGLSFDGRYLAFWGAWGTETKTIRLNCPADGNPDLLAYCNGIDPNSIFDPVSQTWYQLKQVHMNQGIFVLDRYADRTYLVADTAADFTDFLFWGYSGKAPGSGGGDEGAEPPRWRNAAFLSVYGGAIAFKARTATLNQQNEYVDVVDGVYLSNNVAKEGSLRAVLETGMDGSVTDPMLPPGQMQVSGLGIEREGLRGQNLAITVTMENAEESWGGVYVAKIAKKIQ